MPPSIAVGYAILYQIIGVVRLRVICLIFLLLISIEIINDSSAAGTQFRMIDIIRCKRALVHTIIGSIFLFSFPR